MSQRIWNRPCTALLLTAVALTAPPQAGAQIAAGSNGRALDANQAAGGGSTNRLENQVDYRVRNELLTGNVGGVLGFQDDLGYSSSGAFQDPLGSDTLFTFRAQSLRSDLRRVNEPFARGGPLNSGSVVFNNFTNPRGSGFDPSTVIQGGVFGVNRNAPAPANAFDRITPTRSTDGASLGVLTVPDGQALSISADPLRGVVRRKVSSAFSGEALSSGVPDGRVLPSPGVGSRQAPSGNEEDAFAGLQLGQLQGLVSGQLQGVAAHSSPQTVRERVAKARELIFGDTPEAPASDIKPVDNAYTRLLDQIRNPTDAEQSGDTPEGNAAFDVRPEWMKRLTEPPESSIEAAERRLQERLERIREGLQRDDEDARENPENSNSTEPSRGSSEREAAAADLGELLNRLDYDVRLETLIAQREGRAASLYQSAEDDLAAGRFINAERTYRQLRLEDAANPLGRAGLVHAQLGAGMMRAASYNLRALFEAHPELVATRYGERLLPNSERMVWLQGELQRSIDDAGATGQTGLMMAYLGHQVESRQLVRYGLAIAREADSDDPLLPLLERIWLNEKGANPGAQAPGLSPASERAPVSK